MPDPKKKPAGKPGPKRKAAQKGGGEEQVPAGGPPTPEASKWAAKQKAKARVTNGKDAGKPMTVAQAADPHDSPEREYVRGPYAPASTPICGARGKQSGKPCKRPAGWGTDHVGSGKCKLHGGSTPAPTGRYASIERPRVRDLLTKFEADPDPLNLTGELLLLRSLLHDYIDRFDKQDEMLTRWNLSFEKGFQSDWNEWWRAVRAEAIESQDDLSGEMLARMPDPMDYLPSKPIRMADITEVASLINQVGVQTERIRKAQTQHTFTMETVNLLWKVMAGHITDAAQEVIEDDDIRSAYLAAVEQRFGSISLAELASRRVQG